jgi:hypothetical protein
MTARERYKSIATLNALTAEKKLILALIVENISRKAMTYFVSEADIYARRAKESKVCVC